MSGGVLIVGEVVDGRLHPTVRQLVNAAGRVGGDVSLCLGRLTLRLKRRC